MSTLSKGSRGDSVKDLQQKLIDAGFLDKQYKTGFFGDLTQSALSKFQASRKLPTTGTYDDVTDKAMNTIAGSDIIDNHPNLVGTPLGDYMQNLKTSNPGLYYTIANAAQNGVMITPGMLKNAQQQASSVVAPYYAQDAQNSKGILQNYLDTTTNQYGIDANTLKNNATNDFNALNDKEGQQGTWASGARESRMKSLESTYNDKFNSLYNTNRGNIAEKLQGQEYNYGEGATPNISLGQTKADFSSPIPNYSSTSSSVYNPFHFAGRKPAEQASNVNAFTQQNLASQFYPLTPKTNN